MKRVLVAMLLFAPSAQAQTPATPSDMMVGSWTCERLKRHDDEGEVKTQPAYAADGTLSVQLSVKGGMHGVSLELDGVATGGWKIVSGDKLEETLTSLTVSRAAMAGQTVEPAEAQRMFGGNFFGQDTTSMVAVTPTTLRTMKLLSGDITRCERAPAMP